VKGGFVRQIVAGTKTPESQKDLPLSTELVEMLARWKQGTQFGEPADWIFASPVRRGTLPWSYPRVLKVFTKAAAVAQVGHIRPHVLRHTYRAWLSDSGAPLELQRKLMRHTSITMTMQYGDHETDRELADLNARVARTASGSRSGWQGG